MPYAVRGGESVPRPVRSHRTIPEAWDALAGMMDTVQHGTIGNKVNTGCHRDRSFGEIETIGHDEPVLFRLAVLAGRNKSAGERGFDG